MGICKLKDRQSIEPSLEAFANIDILYFIQKNIFLFFQNILIEKEAYHA